MAATTSCGQNRFDLERTNFPASKETLPFEVEKKGRGGINLPYVSYITEASEAMRFDGLSLAGTQQMDGWPLENSIEFIADKNTPALINGYIVNLETTDKTLALEELLEKRFGKADYYYKNEDESSRIWESDNRLYFFKVYYSQEYMGESYTGGNLTVVNKNNTTLYDWVISGTYYEDYIRRAKDIHFPYTYRDFVVEKKAEHTAGVFPVCPYVEDYVW